MDCHYWSSLLIDPHLDNHVSECVLRNKMPFTPGGQKSQMQQSRAAIYQSTREGRLVKLPAVDRKDTFRGGKPTMN